MNTDSQSDLIMSSSMQDQSTQNQPGKKPGKIKECPECGVDWKSGYLGWYGSHHGVYCRSCGWNQIPRRWHVFKERYEYWYRLYRIKHRAHQIFPYKWQQPLDIIMNGIHEICAKEIPFWIKPHLDEVIAWKFKKDHYWIFQSKSRWKYHLMLLDGEITSWQEYQDNYKAHRKWEERYESGEEWDYPEEQS